MKNNLNGSLNFAYKLPAFVTINLKVTRNLYMNYITHYFHYKKYHKVLLHLFGYDILLPLLMVAQNIVMPARVTPKEEA